MMSNDTKQCSSCGKFKSMDSFSPNNKHPFGRATCKKCRAIYQKETTDKVKLQGGKYKKCSHCGKLSEKDEEQTC